MVAPLGSEYPDLVLGRVPLGDVARASAERAGQALSIRGQAPVIQRQQGVSLHANKFQGICGTWQRETAGEAVCEMRSRW